MKRLMYSIAVLITAVAVMSACSSTRVPNTTSISRGKIPGTWMLNKINYEGILESAVQSVFDQGPASNLQGSSWQLSNSGNGSYTLTNGTTQLIYWSFEKDGMRPTFQFKKLNEGVKAKNIEMGYKLVVAAADGNILTLKAPIQYDGNTGYIVYSFVKK